MGTKGSIMLSRVASRVAAPKVFTRSMVGGVQDIGKKAFRPMSPHLHVYVPQLTSILSICHRVTGVGMAFALTGVLVLSKVGTYSITEPGSGGVIRWIFNGSPLWLQETGVFTLTSMICYHFVNGIRHLTWDTGAGMQVSKVYQSGYAMLGVAGILTLFVYSQLPAYPIMKKKKN